MTTSQNRYKINGYIDTNNTVLDNLEALGSACNTWITFDHNIGKWSIVINRAGSSIYSFNDDNIIGGIDVSETDFNEMYNSVEIQFPHEDLLDEKDWVKIDIPVSDRLPNEPLNRLTIQTTLLNDPVQAQQIGLTELKQSRVNKIVELKTDFSSLILKAGDIVDITNSNYNWINKLFRIISVSEQDTEDGNIVINYTCLEYDADVYNYNDLSRFSRTRAQLKPQTINNEINQSNDVATGSDLNRLLGLAGLTSLFDLENIFNALTGKNDVSLKSGTCLGQGNGLFTGPLSTCCNIPIDIVFTVSQKTIGGCPVPLNENSSPTNYRISGVTAGDIDIPLTGSYSSGQTLTITPALSAGGKTMVIEILNASGDVLGTRNIQVLTGVSISISRT